MNVRTVDMKRRFGVEARYPVERYIAALAGAELPDRVGAHPEATRGDGQKIPGDYVQSVACSNPLFSRDLPSRAGEELCHLSAPVRDKRKLVFGLMTGAPPNDLIPAVDWTKLLGNNPGSGDINGIDSHMLISMAPRAGLTGSELPLGDNGDDPIHGREWLTSSADLQLACTFRLAEPRDCKSQIGSCDCRPTLSTNPPICGGAGNTTQVMARATPGARQLLVAKAMGEQAVVGSVCGGSTGYGVFADDLARKIAEAAALP